MLLSEKKLNFCGGGSCHCGPAPGTRHFQPFPHLMVRTDQHRALLNALQRVKLEEIRALIICARLQAK
jgi:hypothetical protein